MDPNAISDLRHVRAQGANVGDIRNFGGANWRWNGEVWEIEPAHMQSGGVDYRSLYGGGTAAPKVPTFDFDWAAERKKALDVLTPYYEQKLKDAGGDVELAKKYIEEDYKRGVRIAGEDYTRTMTTTGEDLASQLAQDVLMATSETREAQAEANRRGTYIGQIPQGYQGAVAPTSPYYEQYIGQPMSQQQALRKQAIERAVQRQQELAGIEKERGEEIAKSTRSKSLDIQDVDFRNIQQRLEEEKQAKAYSTPGVGVQQAYTEGYQKFRAVNDLGG